MIHTNRVGTHLKTRIKKQENEILSIFTLQVGHLFGRHRGTVVTDNFLKKLDITKSSAFEYESRMTRKKN